MPEQYHDRASDGHCFSCRHNPCWKYLADTRGVELERLRTGIGEVREGYLHGDKILDLLEHLLEKP